MSTLTLNQGQQEAATAYADLLLNPEKKIQVITGNAGSGKSTLNGELLGMTKKIIDMERLLKPDQNIPYPVMFVTATTNKAAKVVANMAGSEPLTIHSLLGLTVKPDFSTGKTRLVRSKNATVVKDALITIDEASYIDDDLMQKIKEGTFNCKFLMVGDKDQLVNGLSTSPPPVFHSGYDINYLTKVERNGGAILDMALRYRDVVQTGEWPAFELPDSPDVVHLDGPGFQQAVDNAFRDPSIDPDRARIVCWTNDRVLQYNSHVRELRGLPQTFVPGDSLVTNKPIIQGNKTAYSTDDIVQVTEVGAFDEQFGVQGQRIRLSRDVNVFCPHDQKDAMLLLKKLAREKNWVTYFSVKENWADLRPYYASTVYKAQGSTYDEVFIDLTDIGRCTHQNIVARMLYVAISRARHRVTFYGSLPARYGG